MRKLLKIKKQREDVQPIECCLHHFKMDIDLLDFKALENIGNYSTFIFSMKTLITEQFGELLIALTLRVTAYSEVAYSFSRKKLIYT